MLLLMLLSLVVASAARWRWFPSTSFFFFVHFRFCLICFRIIHGLILFLIWCDWFNVGIGIADWMRGRIGGGGNAAVDSCFFFRFSNIFWVVDYRWKILKKIFCESVISDAFLAYFIVFLKMLIVGFNCIWKWPSERRADAKRKHFRFSNIFWAISYSRKILKIYLVNLWYLVLIWHILLYFKKC